MALVVQVLAQPPVVVAEQDHAVLMAKVKAQQVLVAPERLPQLLEP